MALVQGAETTIGADIVPVCAQGPPPADRSTRTGLRSAELDVSQFDCLQDVEKMTGGIAVAYKRVH